jgi:hypothetical protein
VRLMPGEALFARLAPHQSVNADRHAGPGGQGSERSESEKRRPDGEASGVVPEGSRSLPADRSVDLDGQGDRCATKKPGDQEKVTLTASRVTLVWAESDVRPGRG